MLTKGANDGGCGGVIAAWAYGLHSVSKEIDKIIHLLYKTSWVPTGKKKEKSLKINIAQ